MMMFLESISDKLPLPSAIVANESFFVPSGVIKKCVGTRSGHTPKHMLVRGTQMSLAGPASVGRSDRYRQPVRPVFTSHHESPMNFFPRRTPSGQEHLGSILASVG
jgi:hypothetical protein